MTKKEIEVELRAEIEPSERLSIKRTLEKIGTLKSHTKRLSVMYFGIINHQNIDIRVRITNSKPEVVMKYGNLGAHDRLEIPQKITKKQFMGFTRMFFKLNFESKVGERETFNYILPNNIVASLVFAGNISYMELEKMSSFKMRNKSLMEIKKIAEKLEIKLLKNNKDFDDLCSRLDKHTDWELKNDNDLKKLEKLLKNY